MSTKRASHDARTRPTRSPGGRAYPLRIPSEGSRKPRPLFREGFAGSLGFSGDAEKGAAIAAGRGSACLNLVQEVPRDPPAAREARLRGVEPLHGRLVA